ncbi:general secretion pathway protein GspI [Psychromonas sp. PRT-SC03]|nr:general secretion pathway protein GspI [Psychromonas sp. PRT-SC03]
MMHNKSQGMTLLEVMLALVILATAGLAVMQAASNALNSQAHLEDKSLATWVASNELVELKLEKKWPTSTWKDSNVEFADKQWFVRYKAGDTGDSQFIAVDMQVRREEKGVALASIRTYFAKH